MSILKKAFGISAAVAVCMGLSACSGASEKTNNSTITTASEATTTTASEAATTTASKATTTAASEAATTTTSATTSATTTTTSATTKATTTTTSTTASTSKSTAGSDNIVELPYDIDTVGTLTRNGEKIKVCICHDTEAIYVYRDNEKHELLDTAMLPLDKLYDDDWDKWDICEVNLDDTSGDNNSDLTICLEHWDMTESKIKWYWEEGKGFVYKPEFSYFYDPIVEYDPPEDAEYPDYSMFNGLWKGDGNNLYLLFDYGSWTYSDDGYTLDQGYTQYDANGDAKLCSIVEGPINGSYVTIDGDRINVNTIGDFNYFDGRNGVWERDYGNNWDGYEFVDFTPFVGLWQGAETNQYAGAYLKIDTRGNWTLTKDDEEIDRGYIKFDYEEELDFLVFSDIGGSISGCYIIDSNGDLYFSGVGSFIRIS